MDREGLSMDDLISRQYAIEHYPYVCRRTNCKECPLHMKATDMGDTFTDCELELFLYNLPPTQPDLDEWCTDCKEYDQERHCCSRWNRVIRNTLKDAQQEPSAIRCKDCKYFRQHSIEDIKRCGFKHDGMCVFWNSHSTNFEWYCSNGERSEDEC